MINYGPFLTECWSLFTNDGGGTLKGTGGGTLMKPIIFGGGTLVSNTTVEFERNGVSGWNCPKKDSERVLGKNFFLSDFGVNVSNSAAELGGG